MRLFVAINLPPTTREEIYDDAAPLRAAASAVKWVAAPLLHVTLKFLGERDEALVPAYHNAIRLAAARHAPIDVRTTAPGAFPNFRRPRVVWVGMTGEAELRALAGDVDRVFQDLGIPAESRAFRAHLTLGRVRAELSPHDAAALAEAAGLAWEPRGFAVRTIDLMHSELGPRGPRYSVLGAAPLHARGT